MSTPSQANENGLAAGFDLAYQLSIVRVGSPELAEEINAQASEEPAEKTTGKQKGRPRRVA